MKTLFRNSILFSLCSGIGLVNYWALYPKSFYENKKLLKTILENEKNN